MIPLSTTSSKNPGNIKINKASEIFERVKKLEIQGVNVINFAFGTPRVEMPQLIRNAAYEALRSSQSLMVPIEGLPELRKEVCNYVDRTRGFRPKLNQIIIGPSIKSMVFSLLLTIIRHGDEVILTDPGIQSFAKSANLLGGKIKFVPRLKDNNFKINIKKMEEMMTKKTKVIILSTPHNPTGNILTNSDIQKITELAEKYKTTIISDETFSQIIFRGRHISPGIVDRALDRTILLEDLTHTFNIPGLSSGFCVAPKRTIIALQELIRDALPQVPGFIQTAVVEALKNYDDIIPEVQNRYNKCCRTLVDGLNDLPGFNCELPSGGIYAFPDISGTNRSSLEFADYLLENTGIAVLPGEIFGKQGTNHLRMSFAISIEHINEGLMRFDEIF